MAEHKSWPPELPSKALLGWSETQQPNTIRTDTSAGPAKVRRRFTSAPVRFSMPFVLTEAQADKLIFFYTDTTEGLAHGSRKFNNLAHPRTDVNDDTVMWRFVEAPSITCIEGDIYETTLSLEILP